MIPWLWKKFYHLDLAWVITLLQQQGTFISYFEIAVIPLSTQWTKKTGNL